MTVHVQLRLLSDTSVIHVTSTSIWKGDKGGECCVYLKQVSMDIKWTDWLVELGEEQGGRVYKHRIKQSLYSYFWYFFLFFLFCLFLFKEKNWLYRTKSICLFRVFQLYSSLMVKKEKKGREQGIHQKKGEKKSNNKSLKPPTWLKKGIKNLIICFFWLKPKQRK